MEARTRIRETTPVAQSGIKPHVYHYGVFLGLYDRQVNSLVRRCISSTIFAAVKSLATFAVFLTDLSYSVKGTTIKMRNSLLSIVRRAQWDYRGRLATFLKRGVRRMKLSSVPCVIFMISQSFRAFRIIEPIVTVSVGLTTRKKHFYMFEQESGLRFLDEHMTSVHFN